MKRVVIGGFRQETNSFNPIVSTMECFHKGLFVEGQKMLAYAQVPIELKGMLEAVKEAGGTAIPACLAIAQSGGMVEQQVVDAVVEKIARTIAENPPVDGVFLVLHGATQSTGQEDCCGYILRTIRNLLGSGPVIAASTDLHANITEQMLENADILCGYQTYPHLDLVQTGYRAASLGLRCMDTPLAMAMTRVPMIMSASTYTTNAGPFAELMNDTRARQALEGVEDFSIYQMQPWLDVKDAGSAVIAIAQDRKKAEAFVVEVARRQWRLKDSIKADQYSMDEVIEAAAQNDTKKPYILVDSADSPNAGATGDSAAVLKRIIEKKSPVKTAFALIDAPAARLARSLGVGASGVFSLGGTLDTVCSPKITVEAYVKSLHDGKFLLETPAYAGSAQSLGHCAVLQVGAIDILVCETMAYNGDPQFYRGFGIEPFFYQLVVIKANTSFKAQYSKIAEKIFETDTPGVASANLQALPFAKLPKPFYPFDTLETYEVPAPVCSKRTIL